MHGTGPKGAQRCSIASVFAFVLKAVLLFLNGWLINSVTFTEVHDVTW